MTRIKRSPYFYIGLILALASFGMVTSTRTMIAAAQTASSTPNASSTPANQPANQTASQPSGQPEITIPEHTTVHVRLNQTMASDRNRTGDHFTGTVTRPIMVNDQTVVPKGAQVQGVVTEAKKSGRFHGKARLDLALREVNVNGTEYRVRTTPAVRVGKGHFWRNLEWIGGGAGGGAAIGAIAAGGKGALIGGPIGAAAGTAVVYFVGRRNVHLPAETPVTFSLTQPVTLNAKA